MRAGDMVEWRPGDGQERIRVQLVCREGLDKWIVQLPGMPRVTVVRTADLYVIRSAHNQEDKQ